MTRRQQFKHAVAYGDSHFPYQADDAISVVKRIIQDVRPEKVIHMGDLIDCWQISTFDKDPLRRESLQDDINKAAVHLNEIFMLTPEAEHYYLEGNHEQRLTRTIARMSDQQKEIARLDVFQKWIRWEEILAHAGVLGWKFIPLKGQARRRIFPNMVTKHGTRVRVKSGYTAYAEMDKYGQSGISGHTHRLGAVYHRDFNGSIGWAETGCTCDLVPEYTEDPDWQHGCIVITFTNDWKYYHFESVYIQEGSAIWRDKRYRPEGKE